MNHYLLLLLIPADTTLESKGYGVGRYPDVTEYQAETSAPAVCRHAYCFI